MRPEYEEHASAAWKGMLHTIMLHGRTTTSRELEHREVMHSTICFPMERPVVICPRRNLSYPFAAAEALWILRGDDFLDGIKPWAKSMANYADIDKHGNHRLWGAYGPRFVEQLPYAVNTLINDRASRQAVINLWRPEVADFEGGTPKDVPCTVALVPYIRKGSLHLSVFMRSSDAWLGIPYDWFTFTILAAKIASEVNEQYMKFGGSQPIMNLGLLSFSAGSSHLYTKNLEAAQAVLDGESTIAGCCDSFPTQWLEPEEWPVVIHALKTIRARDKRELFTWGATT